MNYSKWFVIVFIGSLFLPVAMFAQDDNVDWGISIYNVRYKTDNDKVTFVFDASFPNMVQGEEARFGVKAYINPQKSGDYDYITEYCQPLNESFEDVLSGVKRIINRKVYRDVVVTIPNSAIQRAIGRPGQFNVSFFVCVFVDVHDFDSYLLCHPKPFSRIYTIRP
jgi:hypothetical protein